MEDIWSHLATRQDASSGLPSRGPAVLTVTVIMITLATIFVVLRMVSRIGIVHRLSPDDYFMFVAWAISFALCLVIAYGTSVGLGRHEDDISEDDKPKLKKAQYAFSVLYNPALMTTKTSILLFYLTLSKSQKVFKWATLATLAIVNIAGFALTFLNIFQCRPTKAAFDSQLPSTTRCEDIVVLFLSSAPVNIITDLSMLFLPMPILTAMRIHKRQKIILIVTFGFGFFVAAVDVIRIAYLQQASISRLSGMTSSTASADTAAQTKNGDISWYASLSYMWSSIEVCVGIMCACVPGLKPLFSKYLPSFIREVGTHKGSVDHSTFVASADQHQYAAAPVHDPPRAAAIAPTHRHLDAGEEAESDGDMGMMDFLTTPDMPNSPRTANTLSTARTSYTAHTARTPSPTFFDFVNLNQTKSMVFLTVRESILPNTLGTILFLLWGIAYGFLNVLNSQFQQIVQMSRGQSIALHSAYYAGYFIAPLTFGRLVLKYWGFRACFIIGLFIYGCGTLVFWPSAVLTSFAAFVISNLVVGMGLSILEIAANPFVALCGPPEYMELRLNLSQAIQAVGTVVSPLFASKVMFKSTTTAPSLVDTQWTYLGLALFVILLAVVYYYVPLPEATDDDLEEIASRSGSPEVAKIGSVNIIWVTLTLGIIAQFCYVGAQEVVGTTYGTLLTADVNSGIDVQNYSAIAHTAFAASRFLAAFLSLWVKPRYLLLTLFIGTVILSVCTMHYTGNSLLIILVLLFFCEGAIFPLIFAMSLRGMGRATKDASALLTASISGGAIIPPIHHAVSRSVTSRLGYSYCVVAAFFALGTLMPIYCNAIPAARRQVDPKSGLRNEADGEGPPTSSSAGNKDGEVEKGHTLTLPAESYPARNRFSRENNTPSLAGVMESGREGTARGDSWEPGGKLD